MKNLAFTIGALFASQLPYLANAQTCTLPQPNFGLQVNGGGTLDGYLAYVVSQEAGARIAFGAPSGAGSSFTPTRFTRDANCSLVYEINDYLGYINKGAASSPVQFDPSPDAEGDLLVLLPTIQAVDTASAPTNPHNPTTLSICSGSLFLSTARVPKGCKKITFTEFVYPDN